MPFAVPLWLAPYILPALAKLAAVAPWLPGLGAIKRWLKVGSYLAVLAAGIWFGAKALAWWQGDMLTETAAKSRCNGTIAAAEMKAREEATKEDVKAAGSETMTEASAVKRGTEVAGVVEAANATSQILTQIETAKDTGDRTSSIIDWLASPAGFKSLATLLVLGGIWYAANRVEWARVRDYIRGANLGR